MICRCFLLQCFICHACQSFISAETWQAQNDAAAAAAVGGGLEETLMGVEEYGASFSTSCSLSLTYSPFQIRQGTRHVASAQY